VNSPRQPPPLTAEPPRRGHVERSNRRREKVAEVLRLRREQPELTREEIAARVEETFGAPCAVKTVKDYLWDRTGEKGRRRKDGYRGRCEGCGAMTSGGDGPARARERCRRCGAQGRQRHSRESIVAALREWERRFGAPPTSYDLSLHWAKRRGGAALERWEAFGLPAQAVTRDFRTFRAALTAAFSRQDPPVPPRGCRDRCAP
jgi:hypothetical protein